MKQGRRGRQPGMHYGARCPVCKLELGTTGECWAHLRVSHLKGKQSGVIFQQIPGRVDQGLLPGPSTLLHFQPPPCTGRSYCQPQGPLRQKHEKMEPCENRSWRVVDSPGKNTGVGCHFLLQCMKGKSESEVAQLCPTVSDPMDCSPPGSSVHGILQARVLEWGAIAFSAGIGRQVLYC